MQRRNKAGARLVFRNAGCSKTLEKWQKRVAATTPSVLDRRLPDLPGLYVFSGNPFGTDDSEPVGDVGIGIDADSSSFRIATFHGSTPQGTGPQSRVSHARRVGFRSVSYSKLRRSGKSVSYSRWRTSPKASRIAGRARHSSEAIRVIVPPIWMVTWISWPVLRNSTPVTVLPRRESRRASRNSRPSGTVRIVRGQRNRSHRPFCGLLCGVAVSAS